VLTRLTTWLRRRFAPPPRPAVDPLAAVRPERTRLIVGLGNPGSRYAQTRHNVGFRAVDELARRGNGRWVDGGAELQAEVAVVHQDDGLDLVLAKPQTFMNRSGQAVMALLARLGIGSQQALVIYDDMDLPFGGLRLRQRGSAGTHNGMRSVVAELGSDDVPRLRMGISQASPGAAVDHVLGQFEAADQAPLDDLVNRAADAALTWAIHGPTSAMNRYNKT
jgi:PTH1 family peptidyl-tRNA hydrolase